MIFVFCYIGCYIGVVSCSETGRAPCIYQFEETNRLVTFVEEAAKEVSIRGDSAFKEFREPGSKWLKGSRYLFVYDLNGVCVFHPITPELIGTNLIEQKDLNGKPMIRELVGIAARKENPSGWVHYLWMEPGEIFPEWKSSYIVRVETPGGKVYALGSGNYRQKTEKIFISDLVDSACLLLRKEGLGMIPVFLDKAGKYYFNDNHIFIVDELGNAIVDPSFPTLARRNLMNLKDVTGRYFVKDMIARLGNQDSAWFSYMAMRPAEQRPAKKLAYIRKVSIGGKWYIVGSSYFLVKPIWMKF